jgi:hypothetical protein
MIARSLELIKTATSHLWVRNDYITINDNRFASLSDRCVNLIQWVVYYSHVAATNPTGLDVISEVAKSGCELDVFTLNHDLLLETLLESGGIPFSDGFAEKRGDVFQFSWSWKDSDQVRLFKLHGSLDWFLFRSRTESIDFFAKVDGDVDHCKDRDGKLLSLLDVKPMFLTGTAVKELSYGTGLFGNIFSGFQRRLADTRTLICCGYGWGDKGINIRVALLLCSIWSPWATNPK